MWFLPLLVLGAIAVAAASSSRSGRDAPLPARQLAAGPPIPTTPLNAPPGVPGPISVLGEILRIGQTPPPTVILCAIAEAESLGRRDLASDIVQAFVAPAVLAHEKSLGGRSPFAGPPMPSMPPMPPPPPPRYERGSCAMPRDPRAQADQRGACAPRADYQRGTCAPVGSPRGQADQRGTCAPPAPPPHAPMPGVAVPQMAARYATQDEILAMLQSDPDAFLKVMATGRAPVIEVPVAPPAPPPPAPSVQPAAPPVEAVAPAPVPVPAPAPASVPTPAPAPPPAPVAVAPAPPVLSPEDEAALTDAISAQLSQLPGFVGAGVMLVDPSTGAEVFEVSWLRGFPIPTLPEQAGHWPVRIVIVDSLPVPQPTGLPPETVAQMQEAAGLHGVADQTRALAPGSPIHGVPDGKWREFVMLLERESPQFASTRHVGQYRQRRERLAELGINPHAIHGSAAAQRAALDADLANAHHHAAEGGLFSEHLRRSISVPGLDGTAAITLSGMLGVIQCAGLDGAVGWLERPNDRKRYPHTTQAFLRTNGVF